MSDIHPNPLIAGRVQRIMNALTEAGYDMGEVRETERPDRFLVVLPYDGGREDLQRECDFSRIMRKDDFENRYAENEPGTWCQLYIDTRMPDDVVRARTWIEKLISDAEPRRTALWNSGRSYSRCRARDMDQQRRLSVLETAARALSKIRTFADVEREIAWHTGRSKEWIDKVGRIGQEPGFDTAYAGRVQNGERGRLRTILALQRLAVRRLSHI